MIITAIICISITTYATIKLQASEVEYKGGNVEAALNDLYNKVNSKQTICMLLEGTANTVGAKYHCDLGESSLRNFYVLAVDNNTNEVKLIMERNITDAVGSNTTMNWDDATHFFDEENPGYKTKQTWLTKVKNVDLPDAQDIVNAANKTDWNITTKTTSDWINFGTDYKWLFNYTRKNEYPDTTDYPDRYWTKDLLQNYPSRAWAIDKWGSIVNDSTTKSCYGVRPVITVYKSNLAG